MIDPKIVFKAFFDNDINFYAGVPDSLLKFFCAYITDVVDNENHIIAANEGAATSLGIGYHLATNQVPLIYMQNSGLGNIVNPITSLADPQVYSIPMILMIGWRGEPDHKDEPQHVKQGAITLELLRVLGIPFEILDTKSNDRDAKKIIDLLATKAKNNNKPVALVIKKDTFNKYELLNKTIFDRTYTREEAIQQIIPEIPNKAILVATTGMLSRELFEYRSQRKEGHEKDFLTVGGMGHANQIALGISLQKKDNQVFCLDGDGSILMHMGSLAINGIVAKANFYHIVINNNAHDSVGGQPTVAGDIDLQKIASGFRYSWFGLATSADEIKKSLKIMQSINGPTFLEIQVKTGNRKDLGRPTIKPADNKYDFMRFLDEL
jgi:phosphonopyruvate decarboxylase